MTFVLVMPLYVRLYVVRDERRKYEELNMDTSICGGGCPVYDIRFGNALVRETLCS